MIQKKFILIVAVCLLITILTSCGDKAEQMNNDTNTTALNTAAPTTGTETQETSTPAPAPQTAESVKPSESADPSEPEPSTEPIAASSTTEKVEPTPVSESKPAASETNPTPKAVQEQTKQEVKPVTNNIKGLKVIDIANDMKSFWKSLKRQDEIMTLDRFYVLYRATQSVEIIQYLKPKLVINVSLDYWNDTAKSIIKNVLQNTVENSNEVYEQILNTYNELDKNREPSEDWKKDHFKTYYTGDLKYSISYGVLTFENKVDNTISKRDDNGIMLDGVLELEGIGDWFGNFQRNKYLVDFMASNYTDYNKLLETVPLKDALNTKKTYSIGIAGMYYSNFGGDPSHSTSFEFGPDSNRGKWQIHTNFDEEDQKIMKVVLNVLSCDSELLYQKYEEAWNACDSIEDLEKKYGLCVWRLAGDTYYSFSTNQSRSKVYFDIKY